MLVCQRCVEPWAQLLDRHRFLKGPFREEEGIGFMVDVDVYFAVEHMPGKLEHS